MLVAQKHPELFPLQIQHWRKCSKRLFQHFLGGNSALFTVWALVFPDAQSSPLSCPGPAFEEVSIEGQSLPTAFAASDWMGRGGF